MSRFYPDDPEFRRREQERKSRWADRIRSVSQHDPAALKAIAGALRRFDSDLSTSKILDIEVVRLAMDLICDAIAAGAYSGTEWLQFRTRLADSPSFRDAAKYVTDYAPPGRSLYITETTSLSSRLSLFAQQIEKFAASPDFHRPEPMPASRAPESLQESPLATPDHHEEILQAMLELEAFNQGSRKSTRDIAERALGKNVDPAILKEPMSALVKQRLIQTKRGRTGGAWLTIAGRTKAEEISKR